MTSKGRGSRAAVGLLLVVAVNGTGCDDRAAAPVATIGIQRVRDVVQPMDLLSMPALPASGSSAGRSTYLVEEGFPGGVPCTIATWACGLTAAEEGTDLGVPVWRVINETFYKSPSVVRPIGNAGYGLLRQGITDVWPSKKTWMQGTVANRISDSTLFDNTCAAEWNDIWVQTAHSVVREDGLPMVRQLNDFNFCLGPPDSESCGSGDGGGDDEEEEWETIRSALILDPDDIARLSAAETQPAYSCGGVDPEDLECWSEYWIIEYSIDGGITWDVLWEGWQEVCEVVEE